MNKNENMNPGNLFEIIDQLDSKTRFNYSVILVGSILFFSRISAGINLLVGIMFGVIIIKYLYDQKQHQQVEEVTEMDTKIRYLDTYPIKFKQYHDLIDYFFSIQEMSYYNRQAYEECLANVNSFISLYEDSQHVSRRCADVYEIAQQKVNNAINSIHSIIFSIHESKQIEKKLNRAHKKLHQILKRYLKKMYHRCSERPIKHGYDTEHRPISFNEPKPYNHYLEGSRIRQRSGKFMFKYY